MLCKLRIYKNYYEPITDKLFFPVLLENSGRILACTFFSLPEIAVRYQKKNFDDRKNL